ncbi:glycosyltransferase [Candidatus Sumerlaeota bacterium]|nr:glycosyltransferase [Candidatus Sumerlaeota bacterium]
MTDPPMLVSLIVPTYRREQMLCDTLESALVLQYPNLEIIVYDQSPSHEDKTSHYLKAFSERRNCHVFHDEVPSLPRARNAAFLKSRGDIIIFIDDDVFLPKDFVEQHLKNYARPHCASVAGRIVLPGEDPAAARPLPIAASDARDRVDLQIMRHTTPVENPLHIGGGNFSIRREWMERNGGFSNIMKGSALGEDIEFAGRLRRIGGTTTFDPDAWLVHRIDPSGGTRPIGMSAFHRQRDRMRNYYYAIFHGAGWRRGAAIWWRRITNRLGPAQPRDQIAAGASQRGNAFASAAGRFVGAAEGIIMSAANTRRWGGLDELRK